VDVKAAVAQSNATVAYGNATVAVCNATVAQSHLKIEKRDFNKEKEENKNSKKIETHVRGIEGAILGDRPVVEDDFLPETKGPASVMERLAKAFNPNWPKYGENREFDRVCRLIYEQEKKDQGTVEGFVKWKQNQPGFQKDITWYGRRPLDIWLDWGLWKSKKVRPISTFPEFDAEGHALGDNTPAV
jgi:hypothetical protein